MYINTTDVEESFPFFKNLILFFLFITVTPIVLGASLFSLFSLSTSTTQVVEETDSALNSYLAPKSGVRVYASLPLSYPTVAGAATASDARVEIVRQYLERYNSPLEPYAHVLVESADRHSLDYRLTTAIAQQESNLCKIIPPGGHNCWGWGIHSRGTLGFQSFETAIETVSAGLRREYLDKGYETVEEIMSKYTPMSNGSWAYGVNQFMGEMQ